MKPTVSYSASRLRFYADIIEPLAMNAVIEIVSPDVTWRMTKADFLSRLPECGCFQELCEGARLSLPDAASEGRAISRALNTPGDLTNRWPRAAAA